MGVGVWCGVYGGVYEVGEVRDRSMVGKVYEEDDKFEGFVWKGVKIVSRGDRLNKW